MADDHAIKTASGLIEPDEWDLLTLSNNHAETIAVLRALEAIERANWVDYVLRTDSMVAMRRFQSSQQFKGVPTWLRLRIVDVRRRLRPKIALVGGHATKAELLVGKLRRNGLPTSKWNSVCDAECTRLAKAFLSTMKGKTA